MELIDKINYNLSTFSNATNIAVQLLDVSGGVLSSYGEQYDYCKLFKEATNRFCPCEQSHLHACEQTAGLGEDYIFSCPAGLIHFAIPIYKEKLVAGYVLAGPITLEYQDIQLVDQTIQKFGISLDYRRKLYTALMAIPLVEPFHARHLSKLLDLVVSNLMRKESFVKNEITVKSEQQAKISEYIHLIKDNPEYVSSDYQLEKQLIDSTVSGDDKKAKAILNEILGRIYFSSGNNIEIIKTKSIELVALLSRAMIEKNGDTDSVYQMTNRFFSDIIGIKDLTELSYLLLELLERYIHMTFYCATASNLSMIQKSVQYIHKHYAENITLETVAEHLSFNPSYFSYLFKKEMGMNFTKYVMQVRVEKAKSMLKDSNLPLSYIASELGFETQSYFSSIFKKHVGVSPKQYRQNL